MNPKNIKFNYLYRDSGNYKLYDAVIFTNPNKIDLETIQRKISKSLIDGEYFCPEEWKIPILEFDNSDDDLDHSWHEFESVELTTDVSVDMNKIDELLDYIVEERKKSDFESINKFVKSGNLRKLFHLSLWERPGEGP